MEYSVSRMFVLIAYNGLCMVSGGFQSTLLSVLHLFYSNEKRYNLVLNRH
ncbi:hypothetical protein ZPR_1292 [Zunongwangia profunda SM-A87]|uniref:Uncharacterized protein n=1 Tax=Zunongwangia profunda (strain DSM 18752 / CCTCC AB 206139 / SM-A87) TaxID=655815 RepID=D5BJG4_ZUNPS|nr:hypothetical protein ZPR_1292 [Zunongwangia profunda SM-A87]